MPLGSSTMPFGSCTKSGPLFVGAGGSVFHMGTGGRSTGLWSSFEAGRLRPCTGLPTVVFGKSSFSDACAGM
jgi:hypothetical protein